MIFTNIEDIPYPFLHDAVLLIDMYTKGVDRVRVTNKGEFCIVLKGMIDDRFTLQRIMKDLDPNVTSESSFNDYNPERCEDYDYSYDDNPQTYIYSKDGIDYRNL